MPQPVLLRFAILGKQGRAIFQGQTTLKSWRNFSDQLPESVGGSARNPVPKFGAEGAKSGSRNRVSGSSKMSDFGTQNRALGAPGGGTRKRGGVAKNREFWPRGVPAVPWKKRQKRRFTACESTFWVPKWPLLSRPRGPRLSPENTFIRESSRTCRRAGRPGAISGSRLRTRFWVPNLAAGQLRVSGNLARQISQGDFWKSRSRDRSALLAKTCARKSVA